MGNTEHWLFSAIVALIVLTYIALKDLSVFKEIILFKDSEARFLSFFLWIYFFWGVFCLVKYLI